MDEVKSVKSLPFSGKKSEFPVWKFKFLACCAYQKCEQILLNDNYEAPDSQEILDIKVAADRQAMERTVANTKAYMLLSLCIPPNDTITFNAIQNAVTQELLSGDAEQAWKNICEINQPATRADQHDLEQQLNHCVLSDDSQNPDKWFSKLENLRILLKLDHQLIITDDSMITQILYNTNSKQYDTMVTVLKLEMTKNASNLNLLDVKKAYITVFASLKQTKSNTRDRPDESALYARANPGRT
jgi:hypothetical protein